MVRPSKKLSSGAALNNNPGIHDRYPLAHPCHNAQIMRNQKDRMPMSLNPAAGVGSDG